MKNDQSTNNYKENKDPTFRLLGIYKMMVSWAGNIYVRRFQVGLLFIVQDTKVFTWSIFGHIYPDYRK